MASLRPQDVDVFLSDYHFDIAKITALGYAPRHQAPTEFPRVLRECARRQRSTWSGSPASEAQADWGSSAERGVASR